MYRLSKIKELKEYRFFKAFEWDENNCNLFNQNNLIYGWNGSGKTTLCDFLKELEDGVLSNTDTSFSLLFKNTELGDNHTITHRGLGSIPYVFKVFHQNYIEENISCVDKVRHIFSVGKGQTEKIEKVKQLRSEIKKQNAQEKALDGELRNKKQEFENLKTSKARIIKEAANYSNAYNKNKFYDAYKALTVPQKLSETEYQNALTAIRAEKRPEISLFKIDFIQSTVKEYIRDILSKTPVNSTIEALKEDSRVSTWVEQGMALHEEKESAICLFCGNQVSGDRFEELRAHFNRSYKELSDEIDSAIILLQSEIKQFEMAQVSLPNSTMLYPELKGRYIPLQDAANGICKQYILVIDGIVDILKRKKSDMISEVYTDEFLNLVDQLSFDYKIFEEILKVIGDHNLKTKEFQKSIEIAQKKVENHYISEFAPEMSVFEKILEEKNKELGEQRALLEETEQEISALEQEVRNSQIPADAINKDIEFIMGRAELVFKNSEFGYQIKRKGKLAENLSKGEENAIALIYFFNTLMDVDSDPKNTIIVLDDPISSFDSNFYYNAISYIREKTEQVGQIFIFTHKFSLFKDYSLMYDKNTSRYIIQRSNDAPQIINEDKMLGQYHDEYAYLFKKVYNFVKAPPDDKSEYLQYPNIARRLLEGFLTFKIPCPNKRSMLNKVFEMEQGRDTSASRAILRLLNNRSHLGVVIGNEVVDDIDNIAVLPDILKHLLEFMKYHDKKHYDTLALLCDDQYDRDGAAIEVEQHTLKKVKLYEMAASAGMGSFLEDEMAVEEIDVTNPDCTFAVRISGDSMEPEILDGSIALVKGCQLVPPAHVGIVWHNGKCYCKKIVQNNGKLLLVSINKAYRQIEVTLDDDFQIFGEVLETISLDGQ